MDNINTVVLIVTRSIPLSDGLEALLKALSQIAEVQIARNVESAHRQIETKRPRILLLDAVLLGTTPEPFLENVHMLSPQTQRVLLVDEVQEVNLMPRYAEAILIKGAAPAAVAASVTSLLVEKGDDHEHHDEN